LVVAKPAAATAGEAHQLAFDAMPKRLFSCTPSRLASFDCPRRYRMTYLDRPTPGRGAPWAHNTVGAVAHLALHRWWQLPRAARTPEQGGALVERNWQTDGFRDDDQAIAWRVRARDWVRRYLDDVDPDDEPVGVERTVAMTTEHLAVSGRVDRIDDRDGVLVIVDYKTGRHVPDSTDARGSQALALYALAATRTLRRSCVRVELHHLPSGTVAAHEHTADSLARHVARAEASAHDIAAATDTLDSGAAADEVFPPVTSSSCSWCDFRRHCPEGQAASPDRSSWDALAEAADH
jgi:putative RecB family exonuclease